jgi:hypothetical protein
MRSVSVRTVSHDLEALAEDSHKRPKLLKELELRNTELDLVAKRMAEEFRPDQSIACTVLPSAVISVRIFGLANVTGGFGG